MAIIDTDMENNGEEWWDHVREWAAGSYAEDIRAQWARAVLTLPAGWTLPDDQLGGFREWAESLPGWDDGPDYAPHPLLIEA